MVQIFENASRYLQILANIHSISKGIFLALSLDTVITLMGSGSVDARQLPIAPDTHNIGINTSRYTLALQL